MKRQIKFRGKRIDNGEWVYGDLVINQITQTYRIFTDFANVRHGSYTDSGLHECSGELYHINPATIGQFTGLTDRNGKEIYERDLCRVWYYKHTEPTRIIIQEVLFDNGTFVLRAKNHLGLELEDYLLYVPLYYSSAPNIIEVIGNIHETQPTL